MCDQMAAKVHHNALYDESWKKLRATCGERAIEMADLFLRLVRPSIDGRTPEFYNVNAHLGETINEAVVVAGPTTNVTVSRRDLKPWAVRWERIRASL